jgi:alkylation response protein AidB-like acyl-CoA dehydrogenase
MDFSLTKEQQNLQETLREFCLKEIMPIADKIEKEDKIPDDLITKMGRLNLFGIPFAARYDDLDGGYIGSTLVLEELAKASGAVAMLVSINYLAAIPIDLFGNEEQKKKFLTRLCNGSAIGSFAFTEAATGSDPQSIISEAVIDGKEYVLNGIKRFVTAADMDGIIVISVHDGKTISAFIGEKNIKGYKVTKTWDKMGMHGISLVDIELENYRLPLDSLLGKSGDGYNILLNTIAVGKLNTCAIMLGCMQSAMEEALKYARERKVKGKSMTQFQSIQTMLADIAVKVTAARWLTYRLATLVDRKQDIRTESAIAKIFVTETAAEVARLAFKVHGAYAYISDYKIERLLRDIYLGEIVEGSNEVQKAIVAGSLLNYVRMV